MALDRPPLPVMGPPFSISGNDTTTSDALITIVYTTGPPTPINAGVSTAVLTFLCPELTEGKPCSQTPMSTTSDLQTTTSAQTSSQPDSDSSSSMGASTSVSATSTALSGTSTFLSTPVYNSTVLLPPFATTKTTFMPSSSSKTSSSNTARAVDTTSTIHVWTTSTVYSGTSYVTVAPSSSSISDLSPFLSPASSTSAPTSIPIPEGASTSNISPPSTNTVNSATASSRQTQTNSSTGTQSQSSSSESSKTLAPPTTRPSETDTTLSTTTLTLGTTTTTLSPSPSSSLTASPTTTTTPVPAALPHPVHSPPLLLILCLTLLLPLFIAGTMYLYRRTCPDHYASTAKYCPIRRPYYFIKNQPVFVTWRERRARNKDILTRQRDYMSRRTRSTSGTVKESRMERKKRIEEEARDGRLRGDMIRRYGGRDGQDEDIPMTSMSMLGNGNGNRDSNVPLVSGASPPSYYGPETGSGSVPNEKMPQSPVTPKSPKSPYNPSPGVLGAEYLQEFRYKSPSRPAPQSPDRGNSPIAEVARAAHDRIVAEFNKSRTTLGGKSEAGRSEWTDVPLESSESGQSSRTDLQRQRQAEPDIDVPPIPPRSPDRFRFGPPLNIVKRHQ